MWDQAEIFSFRPFLNLLIVESNPKNIAVDTYKLFIYTLIINFIDDKSITNKLVVGIFIMWPVLLLKKSTNLLSMF